jgi:CBS domain-containing protein
MNMQPIATLMQACTHTLSVDDSVLSAEKFFASNHLSWSPVVGDRRDVVGVISAADLVRFHAGGGDSATALWRLCTYRPLCVAPDASIAEVARLMTQNHIHHAVVMEQGSIRGVVSALDLVRLLA